MPEEQQEGLGELPTEMFVRQLKLRSGRIWWYCRKYKDEVVMCVNTRLTVGAAYKYQEINTEKGKRKEYF